MAVAPRLDPAGIGGALGPGGVADLAEQRAYAGSAGSADSVLTAYYLGLRGFDFPDSLVPATGTQLPSLQADLLKVQHSKVDRWVDYFTGRGRKTYERWLERKASYGWVIEEILVRGGQSVKKGQLLVEWEAANIPILSEVSGVVRFEHIIPEVTMREERDQASTDAERAAAEENDHLDWCERRIHELGGRTSLLNPLWYAGSFAIGAAAGIAGTLLGGPRWQFLDHLTGVVLAVFLVRRRRRR